MPRRVRVPAQGERLRGDRVSGTGLCSASRVPPFPGTVTSCGCTPSGISASKVPGELDGAGAGASRGRTGRPGPGGGETNPAIAQPLFISPGTVRGHLERIYGKFEVRNRAEAAAIFTQERVEKRQLRLDPGQPAATPLVDADSGVGASSGRRCASGCQRGDAEDVAAVLRQHGRDRITNTRPAIEEG